MKNNQVFVSYLFVYIAINVCLFVSRAIQYRASNGFVIIARACGKRVVITKRLSIVARVLETPM